MARFNPIEGGTEPPEKPLRKKAVTKSEKPTKTTTKTQPIAGGISGADFMAMLGGARQETGSSSQTASSSPVPEPAIETMIKTPNPLGVLQNDKIIPITPKLPSAMDALRAVQREHNLCLLPKQETVFGEAIYTYSRRQAIEDGVLVDGMVGDLAEISRQHFKYPIAMTDSVFALMQGAVEHPDMGCDYKGVWHDILWMAKKGVTKKLSESCVLFEVAIGSDKTKKQPVVHTLKCHVGPGDKAEPVITIMLKNED